MEIIHYPPPTLRHKSKPIKRVDATLRKIVREMFELMYEHRGVGLAANQADLPIRLLTMNLESSPEEGQELVLINPVLRLPKGNEEAEEGCLSFPDLHVPVKRPATITVDAYNLQGQQITGEWSGLAARAVQHEVDHLDGVLFIDRISETNRLAANEALDEFDVAFAGRRERGEMPDDDAIAKRLAEFEEQYC